MCFWCKEGLGVCDFRIDGLIMIELVLVVVMLSTDADDGLIGVLLNWLCLF